jgi:hypothetical protein
VAGGAGEHEERYRAGEVKVGKSHGKSAVRISVEYRVPFADGAMPRVLCSPRSQPQHDYTDVHAVIVHETWSGGFNATVVRVDRLGMLHRYACARSPCPLPACPCPPVQLCACSWLLVPSLCDHVCARWLHRRRLGEQADAQLRCICVIMRILDERVPVSAHASQRSTHHIVYYRAAGCSLRQPCNRAVVKIDSIF